MINRHERMMRRTDVCFGVFAIAGVLLLTGSAIRTLMTNSSASEPLWMAAIAVAATIAIALVMIRIGDLDRRCSEDYRMQLMTQSAAVAALTTLLVAALFEDFLLGRWFGDLSGHTVTGILIASWALAYFASRIKGAQGAGQ
ncbi:hypothetical protein GCM10009127_20380 [Alteraurantiacibacter aestuarii]|uniref:hypothetical protein n=1 Tax=Alteraurantiacibacter aestuarii TaxID=650004 RepID=UPI0031D3341C